MLENKQIKWRETNCKMSRK